MKIIRDLAKASVESGKKDTLAIQISIVLAVVILGTVVFIVDSLNRDKYNYIVSTVGNYHVSLSEVDETIYDTLIEDKDIEKISFDRVIHTNFQADIYEKGDDGSHLNGYKITAGRKPAEADELMVPERFLSRHHDLKLGSEITVDDQTYTVVGVYDDYNYSFEDSALIGCLKDTSKEALFKDRAGLTASIWYKNPRDTYTLTRDLLSDLGIDEKKAESTGRLYYNTDVLEYNLIYPSGIIPPKSVLSEALEKYSLCFFLTLLFAVMIYGAFNVWNNRTLKEIALLKSAGMTEKQVKTMVRLKSLHLARVPIILGTVLSYLAANLLLYLMWLNNSISYSKLSNIFGDDMLGPSFHIIHPSVGAVLLTLLLSLLTVYLSAIVPAKKSGRLNIIEGLNEISEGDVRLGPSKIRGKIEKTLAEDYFKSYKPTYRVIILSMVLSALVLTTVLVSQSYRGILNQYNTYHSPYNFSSAIYSEGALDGDMVNSLKNVEGIDQIHVYQSKDFKLFLGDNEGMLSPELKDAFDKGKKKSDDLYAKIYALSKRDFERLLKEHGAGGNPSYLLLNKISKDDDTPYAFREYIPITDDHPREIRLKYSAEGEPIDVDVGGYIDSMPYGLNAYDNHEIAIFTDVDHLNELFSTYGKEEASPYNEYTIAIRSKDDLEDVSKICEKIISAHYSKSDHFTDTEILNKASEKEQNRNEHVLNAGIQTILVIIALSNAYNSFQSNLRARRRDFQLLTTAGMTDAQTKTMILSEATMLFSRVLASYVAVFFIVIGLRSYRSPFPLRFVIKTLLLSINYLPILVIFAVMISGVLLAVQSGIKSVLEEDIHASL